MIVKLILIALIVVGGLSVMNMYLPHYVVLQAFKFGGYSITYGLLAAVALIVAGTKCVNG